MNIDCFLKQYLGVLTNDHGDSTFEGINLFSGGTTGVRIGKLINFAVSQMEEGECYVEVGVFLGGTLCQAVHNNYKTCIGIDSYRPEHMINNFKWQEPMLADNAVVILDDINYVEVTMAIQDWVSGHAQNYDMMAYLKPFYGEDGKNTWCARDRFLNNGVAVIRYHKDPLSNTFSYDPTKMGWTIEDIHAGRKL